MSTSPDSPHPRLTLSFQEQAKYLVMIYIQDKLGKRRRFAEDEVFVAWFSKTLKNWKAIVGTTLDDRYYEVTHNGDKNETYVDVYSKVDSVCFPDEV